MADFREPLGHRAQQARLARLEALCLKTDSHFERYLGRRIVESSPDA